MSRCSYCEPGNCYQHFRYWFMCELVGNCTEPKEGECK